MNILNISFSAIIFLSILFFQSTNNSLFENPQSNIEMVIDTIISFEKSVLREKPEKWFLARTGKGEICDWEIENDNGNKVLVQLSKQKIDYRFNLIINNSLRTKNIEMQVSLKAISGKMDQGGGLVWRYQDENNYYVVRANPLENNFRVYKVVNGNRIELNSANIELDSKQWYIIKIRMQENHIKCYLNGNIMLDVFDNTITNSGKVGFWTKSDAVTYFDNLCITNAL